MQQKTNKELTGIHDIVVDEKFRKTLALNFLFSGLGVATIIAVTAFLFS